MDMENLSPSNSSEDEEIKKLFNNSETEEENIDFDIDKEIAEIKVDMDIEENNENIEENNENIEENNKNIEENNENIEENNENIEENNENIEENNENIEENEKMIEELADDIIKIQDRQAQKQMQIDLLINIIKTIGFNVSNINDIPGMTFDRDFLKQQNTQDKVISFIPELRKCYNSAYLTCLHANAKQKQKNLGINVIRQIMKCNYLKMTPKKISHGYDKATGKKLESRIYLIEKMLY